MSGAFFADALKIVLIAGAGILVASQFEQLILRFVVGAAVMGVVGAVIERRWSDSRSRDR